MLPRALQEIAAGLEHYRAQVLLAVESLAQHQADWRPGAAQWSVGEVLHHLVVAEGIAGRMVSVAIKRGEEAGSLPPYPTDVHAFAWRPPSSDDRWVVPVPEPAAPTHGLPIADLRKAMADQGVLTQRVLQRLAAVDPRAVTAVHPLIGDMNAAQWAIFCGWHMHVHLLQMQNVKALPGFPPHG